MVELVMAIVVIGILASMALPRMDRDLQQELADNIIADIRYTQFLALSDYKHDTNLTWQRAFWSFGINNCAGGSGLYEFIVSDTDLNGGLANAEAAIDPTNGMVLNWNVGQNCANGGNTTTSDRIFLTHKFGLNNVIWGGSCNTAQYIGFDHYGRPHQGFRAINTPNYGSYLATQCTITFVMSDDSNFTVTIEPETGFTTLQGLDDA